jgi:hypothetical protein
MIVTKGPLSGEVLALLTKVALGQWQGGAEEEALAGCPSK